MKHCGNCGEEVNKENKYCGGCGSVIVQITPKKPKKEGLGTAAMVIGIISLLLSFIVNILIIPLAISGLIMGIVNKVQHGKKVSGIILNTIAIFTSIIVFIVVVVLFALFIGQTDIDSRTPVSFDKDEIIGTWNCSNLSSDNQELDKITIEIEDSKSFAIYEEDNEKDYYKGTYSIDEDSMIGVFKKFTHYTISLIPQEEYKDNKLKNKWDDVDGSYKLNVNKVGKALTGLITYDDGSYYCNIE